MDLLLLLVVGRVQRGHKLGAARFFEDGLDGAFHIHELGAENFHPMVFRGAEHNE